MMLQFDFSPHTSAIFTYSVCRRTSLMHCGKRCSQTERETEADKLVQKFRHGVLCRSGSLLMRHRDVYTANNNEISDGQTAGGGARIRDEDRQEERGLKGGGKEDGKPWERIIQRAFRNRCVAAPTHLLFYMYDSPVAEQPANFRVGWGPVSLSFCVSVFLPFPLRLLSFLLTVWIFFGCTVCLSMFRYVSADLFLQFTTLLNSSSPPFQYMCLQLPKAYLSN